MSLFLFILPFFQENHWLSPKYSWLNQVQPPFCVVQSQFRVVQSQCCWVKLPSSRQAQDVHCVLHCDVTLADVGGVPWVLKKWAWCVIKMIYVGIYHLFVFFSCFSIEEQQIGILHDLTPWTSMNYIWTMELRDMPKIPAGQPGSSQCRDALHQEANETHMEIRWGTVFNSGKTMVKPW